MSYNRNNNDKKLSWRERIKQNRQSYNVEDKIKEESVPSKDDIVFKHPDNGSNIRIKDDGTIAMFAGDKLGISIKPDTESIVVYGNKVGFQTPTLHFHTDDNGLKWNYMPFNRDLVDFNTEILTANRFGTQTMLRSLTQTGAYISSSAGMPATPGTVNTLNSIGLEGKRMYSGIEEIEKLKTLKNAFGTIKNSIIEGAIQ